MRVTDGMVPGMLTYTIPGITIRMPSSVGPLQFAPHFTTRHTAEVAWVRMTLSLCVLQESMHVPSSVGPPQFAPHFTTCHNAEIAWVWMTLSLGISCVLEESVRVPCKLLNLEKPRVSHTMFNSCKPRPAVCYMRRGTCRMLRGDLPPQHVRLRTCKQQRDTDKHTCVVSQISCSRLAADLHTLNGCCIQCAETRRHA